MSEDSGRIASRNPRKLIERILDQPNLVAAVESLPGPALAKLIDHVGLEDAGEIVALVSTSQLEAVFDEDLWRKQSPGKDETFDADRFALWLEIMLEAGEEFAAGQLARLPEDLVTLAFHEQVLVINIEELAVRMSARASEHPDDDDLQVEKALESCLAEELDEYRIVARRHERWDTLFGLLVALDRDHHTYLVRLLERLCALDAEYIDDNGGLLEVLSAAESLESDVAADREDRRAEQGYVAPSSAAAFLALARTSTLDEILASAERDPITRAYFRQLRQPHAEAASSAAPAAQATTRASSAMDKPDASDLLALLQQAEVLPPARTTNLLEGASARKGDEDSELLTSALRQLATEAPELHGERTRELAYLANVLAAGCSLARRSMRPIETARAAIATCNLGLDQLLASKKGSPTLALRHTTADKLFRIGWNVLFHDVVSVAAATADKLLGLAARNARAEDKPALQRAAAGLRSAVAAGKPWLSLKSLELLQDHVDDVGTLSALLDECPSLAGKLSTAPSAESGFISTLKQVEAARRFLRRLQARDA